MRQSVPLADRDVNTAAMQGSYTVCPIGQHVDAV